MEEIERVSCDGVTEPIYRSDELVRLELLCYPNPEGLHPIEANWRDLARKLMGHIQCLQKQIVLHHDNSYWRYTNHGDCPVCKKKLPFEFPKKFSP
jgi:hypothetical protein